MKRLAAALLTIALCTPATIPAFAQHHDNSNNNQHAAPSHAAPAQPARPAPAQPARPAPAPRPAPAAQPAAPTRGFDFSHDVAPQRPTTQPVARRAPSRPVAPVQPGARGNAPVAHNPNHADHGGGRRISNPQYGNQSQWGWNRGVAWTPAYSYWGGGFWGPFAFDLIAAAFGSYDENNQVYDSYQVLPDSPGADLLANYQLTQTPCGPPNLVVIWGPDNSVICAFPNDLVGPGEYDVDPTTLSLVSDTGD